MLTKERQRTVGFKPPTYLHDTAIVDVGYQGHSRVSVYRGLLIVWSCYMQEDDRIFGVIDAIPKKYLKRIVAIQYHKGIFSIMWKTLPKDFPETLVADNGNDIWSVQNLLFGKDLF